MYKVIIVDDEKLLRQGFIHMTDWSVNGFEIVGDASNGIEALELVERYQPDIVVTDIRMPGMDGIELTRILKQRYKDIQVIVLSSYNDFEYVKETLQLGALDYILKPTMQYTDLVNAMEKAKSNKQHQELAKDTQSEQRKKSLLGFFRSLLCEPNQSDEAILDQISAFSLPLQPGLMRLIWIQLELPETDSASEASQEGELTNTIVNELQAMLQQHQNGCCFAVSPLQLIVIMNTSEDTYRDQIAPVLASYDVQYWLCVSEPFSEFSDIPAVHQRQLALSPYRFYINSGSVINEAELTELKTSLDLPFKNFNDYIDKQDFLGLYKQVQHIITDSIQNRHYIDPYAIRNGFIEVCYYIIHRLDEMGLEIDELHKRKITFFKLIENTGNVADCLQVLEHILSEIETSLKDSRNGNYNPTVKSIIHFIQQHYSEDISLQSIALHFHLNKSYLSQLFKLQTGETLNNYLINLRIDEAKALLRKSNSNIYTVCQAIGYSNPSYFGQVFKKVVGMKPSEYSKLYNK
ncbi:response regulator [Paenibacillus sp. LMG 31456]|uniref:Response regulator n=1 Tax=Paenibacillus foliorum TaxID=2654974 RepID=A0A972GL23_9BACL|nr:response regulator transcription factor [Paenibacillus foliorum]NOU92704.1 response regulator [Paenibacillus foliorum]